MTGFAHSGWGLEVRSQALPNYEMTAVDGSGANEFIGDVTEPGAVDFMSRRQPPHPRAPNSWTHVPSLGFPTLIR